MPGVSNSFSLGPCQPRSYRQRAEIILGLYKSNYSSAAKELKLHSALWRQPRGWCGPGWKWVRPPCPRLYFTSRDYFVTTSLYSSVPLLFPLFHPVPQLPSPLAALSLPPVSVRLLLFCVFVYHLHLSLHETAFCLDCVILQVAKWFTLPTVCGRATIL